MFASAVAFLLLLKLPALGKAGKFLISSREEENMNIKRWSTTFACASLISTAAFAQGSGQSLKKLQELTEYTQAEQKLVEAKAKLTRALIEERSASDALREQTEICKIQDSVRCLAEPFAPDPRASENSVYEGTLTISDRRIPLNGAIEAGSAARVQKLLQYFNGLDSKLPIFIVIDSNRGGFISEGMQILESMEASQAPVYVVVKTYAASMAAVITTLAKRSFVSPSAQILHHQVSTSMSGNYSELQDQQRDLDELWTRFAAPIAQKMGIDIEALRKEMYSRKKSGDWIEYGRRARDLKWVDHVVRIVESAPVKSSEAFATPKTVPANEEASRADAKSPRSNGTRRILKTYVPNDVLWASGFEKDGVEIQVVEAP